MARRLSDENLNDLVERAGDPAGLAALEEALRGDPETQALVEALRTQRAELRAIEPPVLPRDFVASLGVLLEPPAPSVPLARSRAEGLRRRDGWGRLAAAAALGAMATGAAWFGVASRRPAPTTSPAAPLARAAEPSAGASAAPALDELRGLAAELHHGAPGPASGRPDDSSGSAVVSALPSAERGDVGALRAGRLELVIEAQEEEEIERLLRAALVRQDAAPIVSGLAVVRNFSFAEALEFERRWLAARGDASDRSTPRAMVDSQPDDETRRILIDRAAEVVSAGAASPAGPQVQLGRCVLGEALDAAPAELQFALSEEGYPFTITVPAAALGEVLAALADSLGGATTIALADERPDGAAGAGLDADLDRWRAAVRAASRVPTEGRVAIPVRRIAPGSAPRR